MASVFAVLGLILGIALTWSKYASQGSGIISLLIGAGAAAVAGGFAYGVTYGIISTNEPKNKK